MRLSTAIAGVSVTVIIPTVVSMMWPNGIDTGLGWAIIAAASLVAVVLFLWGLRSEGGNKVSPTALIVIGIVGALLFMLIAGAGVLFQNKSSPVASRGEEEKTKSPIGFQSINDPDPNNPIASFIVYYPEVDWSGKIGDIRF